MQLLHASPSAWLRSTFFPLQLDRGHRGPELSCSATPHTAFSRVPPRSKRGRSQGLLGGKPAPAPQSLQGPSKEAPQGQPLRAHTGTPQRAQPSPAPETRPSKRGHKAPVASLVSRKRPSWATERKGLPQNLERVPLFSTTEPMFPRYCRTRPTNGAGEGKGPVASRGKAIQLLSWVWRRDSAKGHRQQIPGVAIPTPPPSRVGGFLAGSS